MKNNMEYVQVGYGAEGTCVKHNVSTCVLQHLIFVNRHMLLQSWFKVIPPKIHSTKKIYIFMKRANLDVLMQHAEHDISACVQCNMWPCQ